MINQQKLNLLKNTHIGKDCVIIACGPSVIKYEDEIKNLGNDKIIIAVKQALSLVPTAQYHILNFINIQQYDYSKNKPCVLEIYRGNERHKYHDIGFEFSSKEALFKTKNFKKYLLENSYTRPWGPGIMYELGFYLAYHLGCKSITTYGWDADLTNKSHFYKSDKISTSMISELKNAKNIEKSFLSFFSQLGIEINIKR